MFIVELQEKDLRTSLEGFLLFKLPGFVSMDGERLRVMIGGSLTPGAQERLLRRLLWAWQIEQRVDPRVALRVAYVAHAGEDEQSAVEPARSA